jgi:DNA-binding MarR family transcriptional regulator
VSGVAAALLADRGLDRDRQKMVTCHLGNGCSMTAVSGGRCLDTSMGLTPLEGLVMGTRSGDLDPAVVWFVMEREGLNSDEIDVLLNKKSGLLGLSGVSSDMRDVLAAAAEGNERARLAIVSALAVASDLSFNELKTTLSLTDGNLSAHARTLEEAGYVEVAKSFRGRRPLTTLRLTPKGREAFRAYLDTLKRICAGEGQEGDLDQLDGLVLDRVFPFQQPNPIGLTQVRVRLVCIDYQGHRTWEVAQWARGRMGKGPERLRIIAGDVRLPVGEFYRMSVVERHAGSGQTNKVTVTHLQGSPVERRMYTMLQNKIDMHQSLVDLYKQELDTEI